MPNDENMDVENIDNEVVETETTQEEQETQEERQLTQEDIDNAVKSRVGRVERKAKRQLAEKDKEIERYKQLENTIRAGLGASDDEDILEKVNSFYKEQGVDIPKYESKFNNRDSERLGELDAQDLIGSAEFDEIQSRANELASLKQSKKISKREEAEFMKLGSYLSSELKLKELKDKGVDEKILEDKQTDGKEFPRVIEGQGYGIIEDCGGTGGLDEIRQAFTFIIQLSPKSYLNIISSFS